MAWRLCPLKPSAAAPFSTRLIARRIVFKPSRGGEQHLRTGANSSEGGVNLVRGARGCGRIRVATPYFSSSLHVCYRGGDTFAPPRGCVAKCLGRARLTPNSASCPGCPPPICYEVFDFNRLFLCCFTAVIAGPRNTMTNARRTVSQLSLLSQCSVKGRKARNT